MKATLFPLTIACICSAAAAQGPAESKRPLMRGETMQSLPKRADVVDPVEAAAVQEAVASVQTVSFMAPDTSMVPLARPEAVEQKALFKKRQKRKGSVCGNIDIQGEVVGKVHGKLTGCGATNAVRVKSVSGVKLSQPSIMVCDTAESLNRWVDKTVQPTFRKRGGVTELKVAAHYSCRTRNNRPGAKISEHGKGKAIDISAFKTGKGETVTVLKGWKNKKDRKLLEKVWKGACGPFGTVLGPKADRYHQDHFHFDVARHRGGAYCR